MNYLQKKKLAFMSVVNSVKGFVRNITGVFPLTLTNCVDSRSIIDYTLYGQSVQNGTPTPETPIEVESVGEKTANLINWDLLLGNITYPITKVDNGYYSKKYFNAFEKSSNLVKHIKSVLKPNITYTLSRRYNGTRDSANGSIFIQNSASENIVHCRYGEGLVKVTFTLTQEQIDSIDHLYIYFHNNGGTITNLQLTESDTVLPYEPYGYKIPVKVSGTNLFDVNKITGGFGVVEYNGVRCFKYADVAANKYGAFTYTDAFKENTRYTFTIKVYDEDANKNTAIKFTYTDGTTATLQISKMNTVYKYTTTAGKTLQSLINTHSWGINRYIDLTVTQLEEGSTATDYEPYHKPITTNIYLDEPLGEGQSINYKKDGLPTIPTFKGTSIISTDTTIQPSNAEIEYYSNVKE